MSYQKELLGASTGLLILGSIAQSPRYAYDLIRGINDAADGLFEWKEGTIYPVLQKLEKAGLVRSEWRQGKKGHRRKYYQITSRGRGMLKTNLKQWSAIHKLIVQVSGVEAHS